MVIKTSQDLNRINDVCVWVNSILLNYIYNSYISRGAVDFTVYTLLNKYINIRYEEEYIIGRALDSVLMNPHELKLLVDFTGTESLIEKNVKESSVKLNNLALEHDDIDTRFRLIRARDCGNVIKMTYPVPVQTQQNTSQQQIIIQIASDNNAQDKVNAAIEKAKTLALK